MRIQYFFLEKSSVPYMGHRAREGTGFLHTLKACSGYLSFNNQIINEFLLMLLEDLAFRQHMYIYRTCKMSICRGGSTKIPNEGSSPGSSIDPTKILGRLNFLTIYFCVNSQFWTITKDLCCERRVSCHYRGGSGTQVCIA